MGIIKSYFSTIFRPYVRLAQDTRNSAQNIKTLAHDFKESFTELRKQAEPKPGAEDGAEGFDGKKAFESLYAKNEWTPELLTQRKKELERSKWLCRSFVWLLICVSFASFWLFPGFSGLICGGTLLMASLVYCVRVFQSCLFLAQINERDLMAAQVFFGRPGIFMHLLFS